MTIQAILFIQSPLLKAVGAYPVVLSAQVALDKISTFRLADYQNTFDTPPKINTWHSLQLSQVQFWHTDIDNKKSFEIGPIDLTIYQGEVIFLIGANGSGKTTLSRLLTGLYKPTAGSILLDDKVINKTADYQQLFSAIFSDGFLFADVLDGHGESVNQALVDEWLSLLQLEHKLHIHDGKINTLALSQGQRKRLALLLALAEQKSFLLLDEWAADQDPAYRQFFYHHIIPKLKQMNKTLFVISHDDGYFAVADRLLLMNQGKLQELSIADFDINHYRSVLALPTTKDTPQ